MNLYRPVWAVPGEPVRWCAQPVEGRATWLSGGLSEILLGTPVPLCGSMIASGDVSASTFRITPDSQRVIFIADREIDEVLELYSVPIAGGPVTKLNAPLDPGDDVLSTPGDLSPVSSRVVFRAGLDEPWSVPVSGARRRIWTPLATTTSLPSR